LFLIAVFIWAPDQLNWQRQRLLAFFCAIVAGLFTFFLSGTVEFMPKRLSLRATGGIAVFLLVLWWWGSPAAPVKVIRKLTPSDVSAVITLKLKWDPGTRAATGLAEILKDDVMVELRGVTSGNLPAAVPMGWNPWGDGFHLERPAMAVRSRTQTISEQSSPSTAGIWVSSVRTFSGFSGTLGAFEDETTWTRAVVEARLTAKAYRDILSTVVPDNADRQEVLRANRSLDQEFNGLYHINPAERAEWPDYTIEPIPINATIEVFVAGRSIGKSEGILVRLREHDEDVGAKRVIAFPAFRVERPLEPKSATRRVDPSNRAV
jgi:hypothetical protein